jgi:hypothetical protein
VALPRALYSPNDVEVAFSEVRAHRSRIDLSRLRPFKLVNAIFSAL